MWNGMIVGKAEFKILWEGLMQNEKALRSLRNIPHNAAWMWSPADMRDHGLGTLAEVPPNSISQCGNGFVNIL